MWPKAFADAIEILSENSQQIAAQFLQSTKQALSVSVPYLMLVGNVVGAWQLARKSSRKASELLAAGDSNVNFFKGQNSNRAFLSQHGITRNSWFGVQRKTCGGCCDRIYNAYFGE